MTSRGEEKAEALNAFLTSGFKQKPSSPLHIQSWKTGSKRKCPHCRRKVLMSCCAAQTCTSPYAILYHKAMEGAHRAPLSIIYQQSWLTGDLLGDWRLANVIPIYEKA